MTPTNQGAGYINSYHLMNEVLGVAVSLTLSAVAELLHSFVTLLIRQRCVEINVLSAG